MRTALIVFYSMVIMTNCANSNVLIANDDDYNILRVLIIENEHFKDVFLYTDPLCFSEDTNWDMLSEIDKISTEDVNHIKETIIKKCDSWVPKKSPIKVTKSDEIGVLYASRPVYLEGDSKSFLLFNYLSRSYYCIFEKNGDNWKLIEQTLYLIT